MYDSPTGVERVGNLFSGFSGFCRVAKGVDPCQSAAGFLKGLHRRTKYGVRSKYYLHTICEVMRVRVSTRYPTR